MTLVSPANADLTGYFQRFTETRVVQSVPPPALHYLPSEDVFRSDGKPNLAKITDHFLQEGRLRNEVSLKFHLSLCFCLPAHFKVEHRGAVFYQVVLKR